MQKVIEVSIVIVTWNAGKFIRECLESVFSQNLDNLEVIITDNNSTDGTLEIIESYMPRVCLIKNDENKGFCFANNQAIAIAQGEYILTLNSDVVLDKDYISNLKKHFLNNNGIGMVQGKFLREDKKTIDSLGLYLSLSKRLFNIAEGQTNMPEFGQMQEIFGPCAAAAMYKRKLIEEISQKGEFFDNDFYFLVEDFDVAWRARSFGWKAVYAPEAICYHLRNSSAHSLKFKQYLSFRNRYFMLIKNLSVKAAFGYTFYFLSYDLPRAIFLLFINPYIPKAIFEIAFFIPKLLQKRYKHKKQYEKIYEKRVY
ncbi:MAG: glycosyltransferase family 2 protein [Candidatus Omnitrophica bacterium]|nr:glycosyltransferase family 2 protein [Candidatus Omnitrophota bacterium]MBU1925556.1 glycosyltransferase family 2 protein [Candidatus Omnitrophota bacterium]